MIIHTINLCKAFKLKIYHAKYSYKLHVKFNKKNSINAKVKLKENFIEFLNKKHIHIFINKFFNKIPCNIIKDSE